METINSYLDSIFFSLPNSDEMKRLKLNLKDSMEDKYLELKNEGKTENEAIGIVISEFGNIDEILKEMGVVEQVYQEDLTIVELEQAKEYIYLKDKEAKVTAIGVSLIIFGASMVGFVNQLLEDNLLLSNIQLNAKDTIPAILFFILLVPAVAILIYNSTRLDEFKFIKDNTFKVSLSARAYLEELYPNEKEMQKRGVIIGVTLCIIAIFPALIGNMISDSATNYGGSMLIFLIAIAVFIFIMTGSKADACKRLLQLDEYRIKKEDKMIGVVASIVWPLATCIFLISGLVFQRWGTGWVVFPITGILFAGFSAAYNAAKSNQ